MQPIKVSIVTSTHNNEAFIAKAIESVKRQTFTKWELIIINDKSTDKTGQIIKQFARHDKRIRYLENTIKRGLTQNLNTAIALAKGMYVARIDGDDIWSNNGKLEKQVNFLDLHPSYGLVGCWGDSISIDDSVTRSLTFPTKDKDIRSYILIENCFIHSAVVIRKKVLQQIGVYDDTFENAMDYDLWLRIGEVSRFYNIPEKLVSYRVNPLGLTRSKYEGQIKETTIIAKRHRNSYPKANLGLFLWKLRTIFPVWIKVGFSNLMKNYYIAK